MPAWITSELRELVCVPIASSASRMITSRPASASSRATARPTTPAPTTTASTLSMALSTREHPFEEESGEARERRGGGHRARAAVEKGAEQRAERRARGEADRADQRRSGTGGLREGRERERGGVRQDERSAKQEHGERRDEREPVLGAGPGECRDG